MPHSLSPHQANPVQPQLAGVALFFLPEEAENRSKKVPQLNLGLGQAHFYGNTPLLLVGIMGRPGGGDWFWGN